ncbi:thioesterase II family protein [Lentzea aerocolonigenes]|uniref:thioesterase II family protein n=1 Tax=Lentzea aerocolonigenes TaxID=68170 RepID=UPI0004C384FF|nr:thioesterase domain-containing protein [Lentzea aerocolonigenes]MCP2243415.1 Surfactin synthase thioesterase subunit [Lentzea aerocolonigenes]
MSRTARASTPWLLREPDENARARLFCLPVSGMGATVFRRWPAFIGDIEVCPVQLPGRENRMREAGHDDMDLFAADAAEALEPFLDRPHAFFGHCLGGRLGYALALAAVKRGLPAPARIFASSCLAPHEGGRFGPYLPEMSDDEYIAALQQGCADRGEPVPEAELLGIAVRVLRKDVTLSCGYQPAGPDGTPLAITTIGWTADADVAPDQMGQWSSYGELRHVVLPGDEHAFRVAPEALQQLIGADLKAGAR